MKYCTELVKVTVCTKTWLVPSGLCTMPFYDAVRALNETPDFAEVPWTAEQEKAFKDVAYRASTWTL